MQIVDFDSGLGTGKLHCYEIGVSYRVITTCLFVCMCLLVSALKAI